MTISLIVACGIDRVIGNHNQLPWHLPADLQYFKSQTLHKTIMMGRKTYDSLGRPLPHRKNVVITRDKNFTAAGIEVMHSLPDALQQYASDPAAEVMIIGGANLFEQALPFAHRIYLTQIHHYFPGDVFFPEINTHEWQEIQRQDHSPDEKNSYAYSFITLERCNFSPSHA